MKAAGKLNLAIVRLRARRSALKAGAIVKLPSITL